MVSSVKLEQRAIEWIPLSQLTFDPDNPRFAGLDSEGDLDLIGRMTEVENVQELMGSIGEQGYFEGEPLLVARLSSDNQTTAGGSDQSIPETYIVVEGNRRLAALKLLSGEIQSDKASVVVLRESATRKTTEAPCLVFDQRKDVLRYLGYRHITGAKRWEPLPKARYLQQLRDEFFSDLPPEEQHRRLAKEIGSRSDYVAQMLTGLTVYDRCSERRFFDLPGVDSGSVDFSLLTTALSYTSIANYIGLSSRTDVAAVNLDVDRSRDLLFWMYSPKEDGFTILGESRKLRQLAAVVSNATAVEDLRAKRDLDRAFLMSEGPAKALISVFQIIERNLRNAHELIPDVPVIDNSHLRSAETLEELMADIYGMIRRRARRREETE
ncbi:MAG: hypothetical protein KKH61_07260 [Gammaproteobacteria bacterium]|nr:hypothetical protein [Gammaproteobacteria bacterium]